MHFDFEQYVRDNLGYAGPSMRELPSDCPFCGKKRHFYVNAETGDYCCFKCDERGRSLIGVVAEIEKVSRAEARSIIFRRMAIFKRRELEGLDGVAKKLAALRGRDFEIDKSEADCVELPEEFISIWDRTRRNFFMPQYLLDRKFTRRAAKKWGLGFCDAGRYAGRIIIPIECCGKRSFTARDATGHQEPRYLNPSGAGLKKMLFGFDRVAGEPMVVLAEGPLDVIKLWQFSIPAVGLLGKSLSSEQAILFFSLSTITRIIILLDPEEMEAPYKISAALRSRFKNIRIGKLPVGVDPGSSTQSQVQAAIKEAILYTGDRLKKISMMVNSTK